MDEREEANKLRQHGSYGEGFGSSLEIFRERALLARNIAAKATHSTEYHQRESNDLGNEQVP